MSSEMDTRKQPPIKMCLIKLSNQNGFLGIIVLLQVLLSNEFLAMLNFDFQPEATWWYFSHAVKGEWYLSPELDFARKWNFWGLILSHKIRFDLKMKDMYIFVRKRAWEMNPTDGGEILNFGCVRIKMSCVRVNNEHI